MPGISSVLEGPAVSAGQRFVSEGWEPPTFEDGRVVRSLGSSVDVRPVTGSRDCADVWGVES